MKKEEIQTFFLYLRRDWWKCQFFSNCFGQGKKNVNAKDAKSIPSPRKFKRTKLQNRSPAQCWSQPRVFAGALSKPKHTQVCLTSTKELAGLSKLELNPAHTKINLRLIFVPQKSLKSRTPERQSHILVFELQVCFFLWAFLQSLFWD